MIHSKPAFTARNNQGQLLIGYRRRVEHTNLWFYQIKPFGRRFRFWTSTTAANHAEAIAHWEEIHSIEF